MDRNTADQLITDAAGEILALAGAVSGLAQGASACSKGGNASGAVRILLDIEEHIHEMQRLLEIASFANRRAGNTRP